MSKIKIESFSNANSRKDPKKISSESAVKLENCDLQQGYIEPLCEPKLFKSHSMVDIKKIYNYHPDINDPNVEKLLMFNEDINIVESPLICDNYKRFYYTKASSNKLMQRTNEAEAEVGLLAPDGANYTAKLPGISSNMLSGKAYLGAFNNQKLFSYLTLKSFWRKGNLFTAIFRFNGFTHNNPTGVYFKDKLPIRVYLSGLGFMPFDYDTTAYPAQSYDIVGFNGEKCATISMKSMVYGDENTSWSPYPKGRIINYPRDIHVVFEIKYLENKEIVLSHYCQTFVNKYGDEGPSSDFSKALNHYFGSSVVIDNLSIPTGHEDLITKRRIYRSDSDCSNENFKLIAELDAKVTSFTDNDHKVDSTTLDTLKTFKNPPEGLKGIVKASQGMFAAFINNEVFITRAFEILSWDHENSIKLGYKVIALHALGKSLIAITEGTVYSIDYSDLEEINVEDLQCHERCVSAQSVSVVDGKLYYASKNGLIAVTSSGFENISKKIMSLKEWTDFINQGTKSLENIHCYSYDNKLFIAKRGATVSKIYNVESNYFVNLNRGIEAFYYDSYRNELLFATIDKIYSWQNESSSLSWLYKTKRFKFLEPVSWSWIKLTFGGDNPENSTATIKFFADSFSESSSAILSFKVTGNRPLRLPLLKEAFDWQIEISSKDILLDFELTDNYEELS